MKNSFVLTFVKWAGALFVLAYLSIQVYNSLYNPFATGTAIYYEAYEGIPITAVAIRNESIINSDATGALSYMIEEGGKVAKGGVIAEVFPSEQDASVNLRIQELERQIEDLETIKKHNNIEALDLELLNTHINTEFLSLLNYGESGRLGGIQESYNRLLNLLNQRKAATGELSGIEDLINNLKTERDSLKNNYNPVKSYIKSDVSGYFISTIDGCEGVIPTDRLDSISLEELNAINPQPARKEGVIGKVVSDYEWYIAAVISFNDSLKLKEGASLKLQTQLESIPELPVTIKYINKGTKGDKSVVIFSCKYMNGELANIRKQSMTILLNKYEGLRVSSKAIRVVDGVKGVYVLKGNEAKFVPVEIVYSTESYAICKEQGAGSKGLRLYDEVIIKGKKLYDGKLVKY
ncbi:MAG TPA: hypothetical protein GXX17_07770 [Clostridiales bacterium]|nr:hypothetical protein [Clostridiales bacterium]